MLLWFAACSSVSTQNGLLILTDTGLTVMSGDGISPAPMLVETEICPTLSQLGSTASDADIRGCFDVTATGTGSVHGDCLRVDEVGQAKFAFAARPCDAPADLVLGDDTITFPVVTWSEVDVLSQPLEAYDYLLGADGLPIRASYDLLPRGRPRIVIGTDFGLFVAPVRRVDQAAVGMEWSRLGADADALDPLRPPAAVTAARGRIGVEFGACDGPTTVYATVDDERYRLIEAEPARIETADSLEVVPIYVRDLAYNLVPIGARAVVRDVDGGMLFGAPVVWTVEEGPLRKILGIPPLPGPDYIELADDCRPNGQLLGPRHARVRATLGELSAAADFHWAVGLDVGVPLPGQPGICADDEPRPAPKPLAPSPVCDEPTEPTVDDPVDDEPGPIELFGGVCGSAGSGGGAAPLPALAALIAASRRRARSPVLSGAACRPSS